MNTIYGVFTPIATSARKLLAVVLIVGMGMPMFVHAQVLTRQLDQGMSGNDVSSLQSFLGQDPTVYPQGIVSGYFGTLTTSAVSNFQSRNGLATVGRVGPQTLALINARIGGGSTGADLHAPLLSRANVDVSTYSATVTWSTSEPARGTVFYDTQSLSEYELPHSVSISGKSAMTDSALHTYHAVTLTGLSPNTTYYYDVYVTDASGNVSMSLQTSFHTNS